MRWLDKLTQLTSENLAREMNRREAIKKMAGTAIGVLVSMSFLNGVAEAAPCDNCQTWYYGDCSCAPPNGRYCSGCGTTGTCPSGYKKSYQWGYSSSGCWCNSCTTNYSVCCDCTPTTNASGARTSSDCGCRWVHSQSGYCVASSPDPI